MYSYIIKTSVVFDLKNTKVFYTSWLFVKSCFKENVHGFCLNRKEWHLKSDIKKIDQNIDLRPRGGSYALPFRLFSIKYVSQYVLYYIFFVLFYLAIKILVFIFYYFILIIQYEQLKFYIRFVSAQTNIKHWTLQHNTNFWQVCNNN